MDTNGSSNEEYGTTELDELIQKGFSDSSDFNEEAKMMMSIQLASIKGRRVLHQDRVF